MHKYIVFSRSTASYSYSNSWCYGNSFDSQELADMYIKLQQAESKKYSKIPTTFYFVAITYLPEIPSEEEYREAQRKEEDKKRAETISSETSPTPKA